LIQNSPLFSHQFRSKLTICKRSELKIFRRTQVISNGRNEVVRGD